MSHLKKTLKSLLPKGLKYVPGTKSISSHAEGDHFYAVMAERIESEKSVALWSYVKNDNRVKIKISFIDEDTVLDMEVNMLDIFKLQEAIETVDAYFVRKSQRS